MTRGLGNHFVVKEEPCEAWEDGKDYKKGDKGHKVTLENGDYYFSKDLPRIEVKPPQCVLIDAALYSVEHTNDTIIGADGHECMAEVSYNEATIKIGDKFATDGREPQALMHEVVHAMMYERNVGDDLARNEELVDHLASGFINLIRSNPALINYIYEKGAK